MEDVEGLGDLLGVTLRGRATGRVRIRGPLRDPTGSVLLESEGLGVEDVRTEAVVLDATVFYDFKRARASVNFKNLTDAEYEMRGFGATSVIPAAPRSVFVGFQYRL